MSSRIVVGRIAAGIAVTSAVIGCAWIVLQGRPEALWNDYLIQNAVVAVGFGAMVWMVVPSEPRNFAVWTSAVASVSTGVAVLATAAFYHFLSGLGHQGAVWDAVPADLPGGLVIIGVVFNSVWVSILLVPSLVVLLLPDGNLPSARWKWVGLAVILLWATAILGFAIEAGPWSTATYGEIQRVAFDGGSLTRMMSVVGFLGMGALIPFCVAGMIARYRRSRGEERQRLRWVAWGAATATPVLVAAIIAETAGNIEWALALLATALVLLVGSFAVAIGKYRLYDVDVVINRTVLFAVLVAFVALTYGILVVGLGSTIGGASGGWTPVVATAVVALAFEPVRHVAQKWANRVAYGHRATPYEVLADLTERLTRAGEGEDLLSRVASLVVAGTGAEAATVWMGDPGRMRVVAAAGEAAAPESLDLDSPDVFPVLHDERVIGALQVVKPRGSTLAGRERDLMDDVAGSAGALLGYRRLNDSLAARADEIELSRRRLVEAEDLERRRLEQELNEGAQQAILALKVNIGLAHRTAVEQGADSLASLLAGLVDEAQAALGEIRNLARGIYPPVLESDGLGAAVSALAAGAPVPVEVTRNGVGRYPPDIEAAVYFDISEAITNAVKHATPPIHVGLGDGDGVLRFSVVDSGPGFDQNKVAKGSGLENLRDRLEAVGGRLTIQSAPGRPTRIEGEVPLYEDQAEMSDSGPNSDLDTKTTAPASIARSRYSS